MADTVLKVENVVSKLLTTDQKLKEFLSNKLRFRPKNYFHNPRYKAKKWDGWKYFFDAKSGAFLTGILPEIQAALRIRKKEYVLSDSRVKPTWAYESIGQDFLNQWLPPDFDKIDLHDYQPDLVNKAITYGRGVVKAPCGCHRKGQQLLLSDGSTKAVEDVKVGDKLAGPDNTSRTVLSLCRGADRMYRIVPIKGESFVVNGDHVLSLVRTPANHHRYHSEIGDQVVDVTVRDWLKWSKWKKDIHKLFRVGMDFGKESSLSIEPYFLGVLLGDGGLQNSPNVTTADVEIIREVNRQSVIWGLKVSARKAGGKSMSYFLTGGKKNIGKGKANPLKNAIRELGLWEKTSGSKFVPQQYKTASRDNRLQLLAGIIDTDGSLNKGFYDINLKSERLVRDLAFIARSLGFAAYVKKNTKSCQTGAVGVYYRLSISGNVSEIPSRIKSAAVRRQKKNVLRTGFEVEDLNVVEDYYGFTIDGDNRYLLDDFTVTHNSGKTFILISLLKCLPPKTPTLFLTKNAGLVHQNWKEMKQWGVENLGRWYDKYKEPNYIMCATVHKNTFESLGKLLPKFKAVIVDEVHECMSAVPLKAYKKMTNAIYRIGISATPFKYNKKKIDEVHKWMVKGHFGPIFMTSTTESGEITTKELQDRGVLSLSDCFFYPVKNPDLKHEPYADAVKLGVEQNFHFHDIVSRLAKSCPGRTLIVVERIEQGEYLKSLIPGSNFIQGKVKIKDREPIINDLLKGDRSVAIVMRPIITAGINIKIHDLINAAGGDAAHNIIQMMGRGLRTASDKNKLRYHDFHFLINDYLRKHSEWRMEVLETESHSVTVKENIDF